jgi:hypothetical protein
MCSDPSFLCTDQLLPVSVLDEVDMLFSHYRIGLALVVQKKIRILPPAPLAKKLIYRTSSSCVSSDIGK